MKRTIPRIFSVALTAAISSNALAFTEGNIVVCRVGDGNTALSSSSTSAYLEEYTLTGTLVNRLLVSAANGFSVSGNDSTNCLLNRSANHQYLLLGGYQASAGVVNIANTDAISVPRSILRINRAGQVDLIRTITDGFSGFVFEGGGIRSVASTEGTQFWISGVGQNPNNGLSGNGIRYINANTADGSSNLLASGQSNIGGLSFFETGLIQTALPTSTANPFPSTPTYFYQFSLISPPSNLPAYTLWNFERPPSGATTPNSSWVTPSIVILRLNITQVLYVADQNPLTTGQANVIHKYTQSNGANWSYKGSSSPVSTRWRGFTGRINAMSQVELFATTDQDLFSLTDTSGPNGVIDTSFVPQPIASALNQTAFRGIAFSPDLGDVIFANGFEPSN